VRRASNFCAHHSNTYVISVKIASRFFGSGFSTAGAAEHSASIGIEHHASRVNAMHLVPGLVVPFAWEPIALPALELMTWAALLIKPAAG
jgi:hypothetical protein